VKQRVGVCQMLANMDSIPIFIPLPLLGRCVCVCVCVCVYVSVCVYVYIYIKMDSILIFMRLPSPHNVGQARALALAWQVCVCVECVHICISVYVFVYMHTYMVYIPILCIQIGHMYTCIHTYKHGEHPERCIHVYLYPNTYTHRYTHVHRVCMYVNKQICVPIYTRAKLGCTPFLYVCIHESPCTRLPGYA